MEEPTPNLESSNSKSVAPKPSHLGLSPYKAKRTVSFKDKHPHQALSTIHHVESLKNYNSTEERGFSCMKCQIL